MCDELLSNAQYFGQDLGCLIGNDAIVTKCFVIRAGFLQTLPVGEVLTHASDHLLIEGPPLAACHGKGLVAVALLLTRFELGNGHRTHTGIAVQSAFGLCAGLAIAHTGQVFGVAQEQRALQTRLVRALAPLGLAVDIRAEAHGIAVALGLDHAHPLAMTLPLPVVAPLMVQHAGLVGGSEALKARYGAPVDLAIVGLLASWPGALGTLRERAPMGIGSPLAHRLERQAPHASDACRFAVRPAVTTERRHLPSGAWTTRLRWSREPSLRVASRAAGAALGGVGSPRRQEAQ
jgi:hypothetical protein